MCHLLLAFIGLWLLLGGARAQDAWHGLTAETVTPDKLRVMSWNIANLASAPGLGLRGYVRSEADYEVIRRYVRRFDPDIVALQEMGSLAAARAAVGNNYEIAAETRCLQNAKRCEADVDDIFTAIAFRRSLKEKLAVFQLDQLAIAHRDHCGVVRPVRGGVGVRIIVGGQTTWIPSLHLKATCKTGAGIKGETEVDCTTQREQFRLLRVWIQSLPPDDAVILAGDFNRRLAKTTDSQIRQPFFDVHERPRQFLPAGGRRYCWSRNDVGVSVIPRLLLFPLDGGWLRLRRCASPMAASSRAIALRAY